ncbi:MAG TPA: TetR family transcriptional regulator [Nocardioides sp.]|uniref:TetR/AcrR family transcriptional regulator n=1 Tax=Nocardioides sp. TaxID=35761 RepID=UPI002E321B2E|nr:TetR family transcriptional regulator [Nocardioides sp.]HEX5088807.1 TetR family transcriptional regulator [Nocardioides sp.]
MSTREKLLLATQEALVEDGIAHLSARSVATRAGVNQALVFYHFGTVSELVEAAARALSDQSVAHYRERFAAVDSLGGLLALGEEVHAHERTTGNVAVMAQLMAGAQRDEVLARTARYALDLWRSEVEAVVRRVLAPSPLADVVDADGLARAFSAAFIGLELYEGVDADGATAALAALERLGVLVEAVDDLGPVARRAVRARLRRRSGKRSTS